jgi:hypothetical protein
MNRTQGIVKCFDDGSDGCYATDDLWLNDLSDSFVCVECPECLDCETTSGRPLIRKGFGLTARGAEDYHMVWNASQRGEGREIHAFTCPVEGACLGESDASYAIQCREGHRAE